MVLRSQPALLHERRHHLIEVLVDALVDTEAQAQLHLEDKVRTKVVDRELVRDASYKIGFYSGASTSDLIRLIRNKWQHPATAPSLAYLQNPDEYFKYFHELFPNLFLYTYYFYDMYKNICL